MKLILLIALLTAYSGANAVSVQCITYGGDSKGTTQNFNNPRSIRASVGSLGEYEVVLYATSIQLYLALENGNKSIAFSSSTETSGAASENKEVRLEEITDGSGVGGKNIICSRQ